MNKQRVERHVREAGISILGAQKGERYDAYREHWDYCGDNQILPDAPIQVNIELTAQCNLKCSMCYRSYIEPRQYRVGQLPLETARSIAMEAHDLGVSSIWVTGGEPLLHPQFPEILKCLSSFDFLDFWVVTNGLLLDDHVSELICDSAVTWLSVSIDAARSETYKKIRGGSLDALRSNISRFLDIRTRANKRTPLLRVTFVEQENNETEVVEFLGEWADLADSIDIQSLVDYRASSEKAEQMSKHPRTTDGFHCPEPFRIVSVLPDGAIAPCCNSFCKTRSPFKVPRDTIAAYWNSDWHMNFAEAVKERRFDNECKKCIASLADGGIDAI